MAGSATRKWLLGCSIGCGVILLLIVFTGVGGFLFLRGTMKEFETAIATRDSLETRYGHISDFTPAPDGSVPAERMLAFLAVRDSLAEVRQELTASFATLQRGSKEIDEGERSAWEKIRLGLNMGKTGVGLGGKIGSFFQQRNEALLASGMGLGEYTYIYCLAYYVWLGHDPGDSPEDEHIRIQENWEPEVTIDIELDRDAEDEQHFRRSQRRQARWLLAILRNQLESLPPAGEPDHDSWREQLAAEVTRLEDDSYRLPWREGLPASISDSFVPFRGRLAGSYSPATNAFELSRNRKEGWSIRSD